MGFATLILRAFSLRCLFNGGDRNRDSVIAIKGVAAWQIEQAMIKGDITKVKMAKRMRNSRAARCRVVDPANDAATLQTL